MKNLLITLTLVCTILFGCKKEQTAQELQEIHFSACKDAFKTYQSAAMGGINNADDAKQVRYFACSCKDYVESDSNLKKMYGWNHNVMTFDQSYNYTCHNVDSALKSYGY